MPTFYVPRCEVAPTSSLATIGQVGSGLFNDPTLQTPISAPTADGPNIFQTWEIIGIYLPISINAAAAGAGAGPTVGDVTILLLISGETVWQQGLSVALKPETSQISLGQSVASADLTNPIELGVGQKFQFGWLASFDQAVDVWNMGIGSISEPSGPPLIQPGVIRYDVIYDKRLGRRGQ